MSIAGELNIKLSHNHHQIDCQISSSRPLQASSLFTGKTIEQIINTLPLLFNICSKAQSVTAVRAIESATQTPANRQTESTREALITIESLREQTLRVAMDWPKFINEPTDSQLLSHIALGTNQLMQMLEPKQVLSYQAETNRVNPNNHWQSFSKTLSHNLFKTSASLWLKDIAQDTQLQSWSNSTESQAARFIRWLHNKKWKNAGSSEITHLPAINDQELLTQLTTGQQKFTAQPDWNAHCYELSWFSRQDSKPQTGNGILDRMVARLIEIAELSIKLDSYFLENKTLGTQTSPVAGLAHSEAARGRLSHYVKIQHGKIEKLLILAPTEWNFHPQGVAKDSLCNLQADSESELRQQAELLIHAIDPCVGYTLNMESM